MNKKQAMAEARRRRGDKADVSKDGDKHTVGWKFGEIGFSVEGEGTTWEKAFEAADLRAQHAPEFLERVRETLREDVARTRINAFASYVRRIGDAHVKAGRSKQGRPKLSSIPFFLSYFWQVQDRRTWPIYYTNAVKTMSALRIWQPGNELAENYIAFKHLYEELAQKFSQASGKTFDLYGVEHVFWFIGEHPFES